MHHDRCLVVREGESPECSQFNRGNPFVSLDEHIGCKHHEADVNTMKLCEDEFAASILVAVGAQTEF